MQYQKEAEKVEPPDERDQTVQRAQFVIPYYSLILIACLIVVSLVQLSVDGTASIAFGGELSISLAGFDKSAFTSGEYWRILTGASLHGGAVHLLMNCYALYVLGNLIETLSNRAHLTIVFFLAAIGGGILSLIFLPENSSVGASGGIIGLLGYLAVYGFVRRKLLSNAFLKDMLLNVVLIALVGIFVLPNVDNFGHLGGLIVGAVYGFIQIPRDLHRDPRETGNAGEIAGLISLGTFVAVCVFSILLLLRVI